MIQTAFKQMYNMFIKLNRYKQFFKLTYNLFIKLKGHKCFSMVSQYRRIIRLCN